ncbi:MAG: hypothetical protein DHS20C02_14900 [Micavibrio sp.]|nr:MAG: hypothetical protein DHS20C02_14900 [Micavibrio sp.]
MQDEEKQSDDFDDDLLDDEDDFDFDDITDESDPTDDFDDDLGDDSWDDFDDIPDAEIAEAGTEDKPGNDIEDNDDMPVQKPAKRKSFVSKNLKIIIVAVAALGGGGLFLVQMGGSPDETHTPIIQTDMTAEIPAQQDPLADLKDSALPDTGETESAGETIAVDTEAFSTGISEALPMPSPMSSPTPEAAPAPSQVEVLTPMPEMAVLSEQSQLASIDEPLEEDSAGIEVASPLPVIAEEIKPEEPEPKLELIMEDISEPPAPPVAIESEEPEMAMEATSESAITAANTDGDQLQEVYEKIETLEQKMANSNEALGKKIAGTDSKISELTEVISKLEERITTLNASAAPTIEKPAATNKTPASVAQPTVKPAKTINSSKTGKKSTSAKWTLRSAQPGKAMVSDKGSGDFKTVKVGDTLSGIGRIVSIDLENNKWVVTGTKGRISQ